MFSPSRFENRAAGLAAGQGGGKCGQPLGQTRLGLLAGFETGPAAHQVVLHAQAVAEADQGGVVGQLVQDTFGVPSVRAASRVGHGRQASSARERVSDQVGDGCRWGVTTRLESQAEHLGVDTHLGRTKRRVKTADIMCPSSVRSRQLVQGQKTLTEEMGPNLTDQSARQWAPSKATRFLSVADC